MYSNDVHFVCTDTVGAKNDTYSWKPVGEINKTQYYKFNLFEAKQAIKSLGGEWDYWIEPTN